MKKTSLDAEFYTIHDIANLLKVDYKVVYRKVSQGEIPSVRIGPRLIRIRKTIFDSWLESKEVTA